MMEVSNSSYINALNDLKCWLREKVLSPDELDTLLVLIDALEHRIAGLALETSEIGIFMGEGAYLGRCPSCKKVIGTASAQHSCPYCGKRVVYTEEKLKSLQ